MFEWPLWKTESGTNRYSSYVMKTRTQRSSLLAGLGLVSLLAYAIACTSFSPDDSKVMFPAFDAASGGGTVMVYDRKSRNIEQVFAAIKPSAPGETNREPSLLRPEWLPDGKHILVADQGKGAEGNLELTVLPYGVREPVRRFRLGKSEIADGLLMLPLPILGSDVFLVSEHKGLIAMNLVTGKARVNELTNDFTVWAGPSAKTLFCYLEYADKSKGTRFGRIDPDTLAFEPIMEIPAQANKFDLETYTASSDGERLILVGETGNQNALELQVYHAGKLELSRPIDIGTYTVKLSPASALSPKGDCLYASFMRAESGKTSCDYGLLEVPLSEAPLRWTTLIHASKGDDGDVMFFQGGLSHDGRAWAVASAYLWAQNEAVSDSDCALYLVDLTSPQRKVTQTPIPHPPQREDLTIK